MTSTEAAEILFFPAIRDTDGLQQAGNYTKAEKQPDLILLDVNMPGMDGFCWRWPGHSCLPAGNLYPSELS